MTLPNLFVAGAQKSGTTALHGFLASHPEIHFPNGTQEIHFFDVDDNFARGIGWYERFFDGWQGERYVAQTSPLYMYVPAAPGRIAALAPDARFVFILRNPIDRAYSHYWHEVRYGWETLPFAEALACEEGRLARGFDARRHFSYVGRGRYAHQITRYLDHFPRERIHIEISEGFARDPVSAGRRCARFLGLDAAGFDGAEAAGLRRNQAMLPRWLRLQRWGRRLHDRAPRLYAALELVNVRRAAYPPLEPSIRVQLAERLRDDVAALTALCGLDPSCWSDFA